MSKKEFKEVQILFKDKQLGFSENIKLFKHEKV